MATISVSNLTFYYDGSHDTIFENVTFELDTKWKLGFCGRNGRGKTTFLKLLMGEYEYRGRITSDVQFDYFPFEVRDPLMNVLDLLFEITPTSFEWQFRKELSMLAVSEDVLYRPFHTLSSGEKTKVLLAGLFLKENHFLLIDEPTNHLDAFARGVVATYLNNKNGFILVSHDRAFLDVCCDHTLSINKTNIDIVKGNFSSWWAQTERQEHFEQMQDAKLNEEIKHMEKEVSRNKGWANMLVGKKYAFASNHRSPGSREARLRRDAKRKERHIRENIEDKKKLLRNVEAKEELDIHPLDYHESQLLFLNDISIRYAQHDVLQKFSLAIEQGDRLAIIGGNGTGKSSLLKSMIGEIFPTSGTVQMSSGLIISYVPQDATFVTGKLNDFAADSNVDLTLLKTILRKLDFSRDQLEKNMALYSAGQKKKVLIAKSLSEKAHLYLWDEPLNYIDVISRMQIEELLLTYQPTMVFVEHDVTFVENVANQVIQL